jgi:putative flippase GtrA
MKKKPLLSKEILRALKFTFFSISAGVIEILVFTVLNELTGLSYWPCYLVAVIMSVLWNFTLNRRYTFQSADNISIAMIKVFAFYLVFIPISTLLGHLFVETLLWNEYAVTGLIMLCNFVTEYVYDRFYVFKKTLDTNSLAGK